MSPPRPAGVLHLLDSGMGVVPPRQAPLHQGTTVATLDAVVVTRACCSLLTPHAGRLRAENSLAVLGCVGRQAA